MEPQNDTAAILKITLFASFQVWLNGRSLTDFATDKARALLVYLVVERQQPHRRERLASLFWPDQPEARARQSLRQALSHLRQALGDDDESAVPFLLIDRQDVQFNPQADLWLDAAQFAALAAANERHHHRQLVECLPCLRRMEAMLALYADDFLAGFSLHDSMPFEEWLLLKREWFHCQAMEALGYLADFYESRGDLAAARRYSQQMVRLEPWREEAHCQLMRLLAYEGQRSAALAQYEACRRALKREFGLDPTSETNNLHRAIRDGALLAGGRPAAALPSAATPFVGRAAECAELADMLANPDGRLITVIGPGGVGKTRLALQTAADHLGIYADGVCWVALAAVYTADLIIPTLAQALGFVLYGKEPPQTQLLAYLREKRMLLVLDNVEHLPAIADIVAALLQQAPQVNLLVTSRERLALREEWLFAVEGLAYEPPQASGNLPQASGYLSQASGDLSQASGDLSQASGDLSQASGDLSQSLGELPEAAQLFVQSVQRMQRHFRPTAVDRPALFEICRLVEGMPLAVELAAAWVPERGCAAVAQSLAQDMALLTSSLRNAPQRQRSMQATFEYSWARLLQEERPLLARLSVFRGGFSADAAALVADVETSVLVRLAAKSLVRVGESRYQLHELLRQFAAQKLAAFDNETSTTAARHAAYYLAFLAGQEMALKGVGQEAALAAIDQEIANVRHAWAWAVAEIGQELEIERRETAAMLVAQAMESLYLYYALRSWYQEGASVFARAGTAVSAAMPHNHLLRGELLARQARCLEFTAPSEQAVALYQESLACFRAIDAEREMALPLYGLGYMAHIQGDYDASRRYFGESLAQYQAADNRWGMATVQSSLCLTLRRQGAFAEAAEAGRKSLVIRREIGDRRGIASSQNNLGLIYCALGDFASAEEALRESISICREMGHTVGVANALTSLCHVFVDAKAYDQAVQVQREAQVLFQEVGDLWGVAIAYNNLGQIAMEEGKLAAAQSLLQEAVQMYRELGIQSSLAHALSNLGKTSYELGDAAAAGRYLHEGLAVAVEIGDRPIGLEILTRLAVLEEGPQQNGRCLVIMAFALQQPELFAETRKTAVCHYAAMQTQFSPEAVAAAEENARSLDFEGAIRLARRDAPY